MSAGKGCVCLHQMACGALYALFFVSFYGTDYQLFLQTSHRPRALFCGCICVGVCVFVVCHYQVLRQANMSSAFVRRQARTDIWSGRKDQGLSEILAGKCVHGCQTPPTTPSSLHPLRQAPLTALNPPQHTVLLCAVHRKLLRRGSPPHKTQAHHNTEHTNPRPHF